MIYIIFSDDFYKKCNHTSYLLTIIKFHQIDRLIIKIMKYIDFMKYKSRTILFNIVMLGFMDLLKK